MFIQTKLIQQPAEKKLMILKQRQKIYINKFIKNEKPHGSLKFIFYAKIEGGFN